MLLQDVTLFVIMVLSIYCSIPGFLAENLWLLYPWSPVYISIGYSICDHCSISLYCSIPGFLAANLGEGAAAVMTRILVIGSRN